MAKTIFRFGLFFIGIAAMAIGASIALLGIEPTGRFFVWILSAVYDAGPLADLGQPNDDSELRFYSVFFIAYGYFLMRTARDPKAHIRLIPWLLCLFFAGGVVRALSYIMVGPPHALFVLLMFIELLAPPILWTLWRAGNRS